jgi:hypothetical protein
MKAKIVTLVTMSEYSGEPCRWSVIAVVGNVLIERRDNIRFDRDVGRAEAELEAAYAAREWTDAELADKPAASTPCSACGKDTIRGSACVSDRTFCRRDSCQGAIRAYQESIRAEADRYTAKLDQQQQAETARRFAEAREAETGFHWQRGWFFKRQPDGSVRVSHVEPRAGYVDRQFLVPPDEWASIVASVSAGGETGDRWQQAREFHSATSEALR